MSYLVVNPTKILARTILLLGFALVAVCAVLMAAGLAFTGYLVFLMGLTKLALLFWACACGALVCLGVLGSYLPSWLRSQP